MSTRAGIAGRMSAVATRAPGAQFLLELRRRYNGNAGDFVAAGITYYGFLSLFPLLLVGLSTVGFLLASHPALREEWNLRLAASLPGTGAILADYAGVIVRRRAVTGFVGVAGLLWSGKGIVLAARHGLSRVHGFDESGGFVEKYAWALVALIALAVPALASAGLVGLAGAGSLSLLMAALALLLDMALFLIAYRLLTRRDELRLRVLWPGAVLAGTGWTALKIFGAWYVSRTVSAASAVYGAFAATIGLLVLLYVAARLFLYGAELNALLLDRVMRRQLPGSRVHPQGDQGRLSPPHLGWKDRHRSAARRSSR